MKNITILFYAVLGGFILASCGGSGGGATAPSTESPAAEQRVIALNDADEVRALRAAGQIGSSIGNDAHTITVVLTQTEYDDLLKILEAYRNNTVTVIIDPRDNLDDPGDPDYCYQNSDGTWICVKYPEGYPESGELITTDISPTNGLPYRHETRLCGSETGIIYYRGNAQDASEIRMMFGDSWSIPYYALERGGKIMVPSDFGEIYFDVLDNGGLKWNEEKSGSALFSSDNLLIAFEGTPSEWRVFQQGTDLYVASPVPDSDFIDPNQFTCEHQKYLLPGDFAFPENMFRIPDGKTVFSLRGNLRGHMDEAAALRLDNFFFTSDSELRDLHLEYRATPFQNDSFALHADGGFRRWGHNDTNAAY
ncbi:MAG: hypothetical protein ACR2P5_07925, partial [Gammaproteobacteria bacterium]